MAEEPTARLITAIRAIGVVLFAAKNAYDVYLRWPSLIGVLSGVLAGFAAWWEDTSWHVAILIGATVFALVPGATYAVIEIASRLRDKGVAARLASPEEWYTKPVSERVAILSGMFVRLRGDGLKLIRAYEQQPWHARLLTTRGEFHERVDKWRGDIGENVVRPRLRGSGAYEDILAKNGAKHGFYGRLYKTLRNLEAVHDELEKYVRRSG